MPILLVVNRKLVVPCKCKNRTSSHWSGLDIRNALGRPLADADLIDFTIQPDALASLREMMEPS